MSGVAPLATAPAGFSAADGRTRLLASVAGLEEAGQAIALGADIVDLKDPTRGALGAWPVELVHEAVLRWRGVRPLSATIGDLQLDPLLVRRRVAQMAATGVDIVKIGIFEGDLDGTLAQLAPLAADGCRLIAVMFADRRPPLDRLAAFRRAGFAGVMLDTADKRGGGLCSHLPLSRLARFVATARHLGLITGLAGSLAVPDVGPLAALGPDYLGFRGALCRAGRTSGLDPECFAAVRDALAAARPR